MQYLPSTFRMLVIAASTFAGTASAMTAETALLEFCEPLISGSTTATLTQAAKAKGFKPDRVGAVPVLVLDELIVSLSDMPRVCLVQAPASMTFAQGVSLVDAWAARHPGAVQAAATRGPDGSPVKAWSAPRQKRSLLVAEQTNPRGQKVLNFILMPLPAG